MQVNLPEEITDDFPKLSILGAVSGAGPKVLVVKDGDRYVEKVVSNREHRLRYENCRDLVQQLADYCAHKAEEVPSLSLSKIVDKTLVTVRRKAESSVWDLSPEEVVWISKHLRRHFDSNAQT